MTDLSGKLAVVTGATRGIGYSCARALAKAGAHVILIGKTQSALESLYDRITAAGGQATGVPLDLTDYEAIDRLGASIFERWGKLDILVGNAGLLGQLTPASHIGPEEFDKTFAVNVTANMRLIRSLEPLLLQAEAPRCVFVTSAAVAKNRPFWATYAASKAALNALVLSWAAEHKKRDFRINLLNPGPVRTQMRAKAMPGEDPDSLTRPDDLAPLFLELLSAEEKRHGEIVDYRPS
jgi:NAD(P)-dependent dehydrogenase (short-subunit alcohol dehydrogenase family)